jgi:hypothetical protein
LRRKNAQLADASGFTELALPLLGGRLHVIALAQERTGGFPGPGSQPTPNIHRSSLRALVGIAYERRAGSKRRVQLVASNGYNFDRYTDLYGELGTSQRWNTNDKAYRGFLRLALTQRIVRWLEGTLVTSYTVDHYDWRNQFTFPKPAPSTRHAAAAALELAARASLGPVGFELRPSARVEWSRTALHANQGASGQFDASRGIVVPTARLGAGVIVPQDVALSASIATGTRLPTMFELFGDRGLVLPSPDLEPVSSLTYDGGAAWCTKRQQWSASTELHAFLQQRRDAIAMFRTAQWQVGHENVSQVEQKGAELGVSGSLFDIFSLRSSLTYLRTGNALAKLVAAEPPSTATHWVQLDKRLALRPQWVLFARPEATFAFTNGPVSSVGASAELYYRSFVFVDRANLASVPACRTTALGVALGFLGNRLRLAGRMEDAADARCSDLVGYPLPGRSLFFSLSYQEDIHDQV